MITSTTSPTPRILIIGIDGGSFDTIDPLVRAGRLPNLARLLRDSASSRTTCTWPAHTAPGWSSFVSASHPGRHGIFQFFDVQEPGYGARATQSHDLGRSSVWDWAAAQGWSLGLINVPMSHPPADLPGYQITWPLKQTLRYCRPPGLLRELAAAEAHFQSDLTTMFTGDMSYLDIAEDNVAARMRSVRHLMTSRPTDIVMVALTEADRVGHHYWHFADPTHPRHVADPDGKGWDRALSRIYGAIDNAVGELLELVDEDTTVVLVSDHGLGIGRYGLAVHTVLAEAGLLTTVAGGEPAPGTASWFTEGGRRVDFDRTRLYLPVPGANGLNINERGRQHRGIVEPRLRESMIAAAVDTLASLRTPDGNAVFQAVLPREEAYPGPLCSRAPDILLQPADETVLVTPELTGDLFRPSQQTGLHRHEGIWAQRSPRMVPGRRTGLLPLVDAVPAMLSDVRLAWPDDIDGSYRCDLFADKADGIGPRRLDSAERWPAGARSADPAIKAAEDAFTTETLRTMGYL